MCPAKITISFLFTGQRITRVILVILVMLTIFVILVILVSGQLITARLGFVQKAGKYDLLSGGGAPTVSPKGRNGGCE